MQLIFPCANQDSAQLGCPPAFNTEEFNKNQQLPAEHHLPQPPSDSLCSEQALGAQTQTKTFMAGQTTFLIL